MVNKSAVDIFLVLEFLDKRSLEVRDVFLDDPEALKEFDRNIGWLIPQWFTGAVVENSHREQIEAFDEICNPWWSRLSRFPELQAKLLASAGGGRAIRHRFYKPTGSRKTTNQVYELLRKEYPDGRNEEFELWIRKAKPTDLKELAQRYGYQKEEAAKLVAEFKKLTQ